MIKQNSTKAAKAVVTPTAFVRATTATAETQSYDWHTQRNSVMGTGTFYRTFTGPMEQWESD